MRPAAARPDPNYPNADGSLDVYGLDPATLTLFPAATTFDLMSYCSSRWLSAYNYSALFDHFHPGPDLATVASVSRFGAALQPAADGNYLVAAGRISQGQVNRLEPFYRLNGTPGSNDQPDSGAYSLEVQAAGGQALFTRAFDLASHGDSGGDDGVFREIVPFPAGAARIAVKHGGAELAGRAVSAHAPEVKVLAPNGPCSLVWRSTCGARRVGGQGSALSAAHGIGVSGLRRSQSVCGTFLADRRRFLYPELFATDLVATARAQTETPAQRCRQRAKWNRPREVGLEFANSIFSTPMDQPHFHLPTSPSRFIGRARELARVRELLQAASLLTLTGLGGSGKTRLALRTATNIAPNFADGIYWCDLTHVSDLNYVPHAVASILGIAEQRDHSATETTVEFIHTRQVLLVFDNCEHVLDACAMLAAALLAECPNAKILTTSLQPLGLPQEKIYPVPPLALPEADSNLDELSQCDAIRLFITRASEADLDFALTQDNAPLIAAICRRLDALPLAIELAAARVKLLTVEQIAERLDDAFQLLTRGKTDALARHQTLRATMDWAYSFLSAPEQILLRRLAVFAGAFNLEMVQVVCASKDEASVLDLLTGLVDKSFVTVLPHDGASTARYRLLETIRQYAREKLEASGEVADLRTRALTWFAEDVERVKPQLTTAQQSVWLDQLEANLDNLRVALRWACTSRNVEQGLQLANALGRLWMTRDHLTEGRAWLEELLRLDASSPTASLAVRAEALFLSGRIGVRQWDDRHGARRGDEALKLFRALGDQAGIARTLNLVALVAQDEHRYADAIAHYEQALALNRELNDSREIGVTFTNLGLAYEAQGDLARATQLWEQVVALLPRTSEPARVALGNLGDMAILRGDYAQARLYLDECLAAARAVGNRNSIAGVWCSYGELERNRDNLTQAEKYFSDALKLSQELGFIGKCGIALCGLGDVARMRGETVQARAWYEQGLAEYRRAEYDLGIAHATARLALLDSDTARMRDALQRAYAACAVLEFVNVLEQLASIVARQGEARRAASWLAFAAIQREKMGAVVPRAERGWFAECARALRAALGATAFTTIQTSARALTLDQVAAEALEKTIAQPMPAEKVEPELRAFMLGPTRVLVGGRTLMPVDWKYTKARELFFYLLANPPATKAQIGLELWQDASSEQLRNIFHRAMHYCRQAIGHPEWIQFVEGAYTFDCHAKVWSDLHEFETLLDRARSLSKSGIPSPAARAEAIDILRQATELWRGDFLADLDGGEWVIFKCESLRQMFLQALLDLGALCFADARYAEAVAAFQRVLSFDNYLEVAHRELMRCYARQGDVAHAMRHFDELRQLMREEFGAEPSAETLLLYDRLRRGDDV